MNSSALRVGVGTRVIYDGELLEVAEMHVGRSGNCGGYKTLWVTPGSGLTRCRGDYSKRPPVQ
jgi:hypothetical protein